jgi:hypothetical protein
MDFEPERIRGGWRLTLAINGKGRVLVEVVGAHRDRERIRGVLTVRTLSGESEALVYRGTINLTSPRARKDLCATLAEKEIQLDERALLALEDACRRPPARPTETTSHAADADVPEITLPELLQVFGRWLLIDDRAYIPVLVGAALAHRLRSDPVWPLVVAPPGGTKTEPLRAFVGSPGFYPLSELTPKTFASGLEIPGGSDPSLLLRLTDEVLIFKDFTTVLQMRHEDQQAILAQLREIYDGRYDKTWGTGRELHWEGRLGFIAGVTPIIDKHQGVLSVLGERFVLFRVILPNRKLLALSALKCRQREGEMRHDLARAMRGFLAARGSTPPDIDAAVTDRIATVADFVTRARSGVQRDGWKRELEYAPEPEAPTRFAKVLASLASGIALAYDSPTVASRELRLILRVALDCLPLIRRRVIGALVEHTITEEGDRLSTSAIAGEAQFSTPAIRRTLEDLQALEVAVCHKAGAGKADQWALADPWTEVFRALARDAQSVCDGGEEFSGTPPPEEDWPEREPGEDEGNDEEAEWSR